MSWKCEACEEINNDEIIKCPCGNDINNSVNEVIEHSKSRSSRNRSIEEERSTKSIGFVLISIGIVLLAYSIFYSTAIDGTHNIGLLNNKIYYIIASIGAIISGILTLIYSSSDNKKVNDSRECPHCAEIIKVNAKICRFCGNEAS